MSPFLFLLELLAGAMIVTPFVVAVGNIWIDRWYKRKLENDEKWCEMTGVWKGGEIQKRDTDE